MFMAGKTGKIRKSTMNNQEQQCSDVAAVLEQHGSETPVECQLENSDMPVEQLSENGERMVEGLSQNSQGAEKQLSLNRAHLKLPGSALKVYLCHFLHENGKNQSWPSIETICEDTGLSWNTVVTWRAWLLKHGWLVYTGKVKAPKNGGAYPVPIVNRPTQNLGTQSLDLPYPKFGYIGVDGVGDGVSYGSSFDSSSATGGGKYSHLRCDSNNPTKSVEVKNLKQSTPPPAPTPTPKPEGRKLKLAPDGTPYPAGFDTVWSNPQRQAWRLAHLGVVASLAETAKPDLDTLAKNPLDDLDEPLYTLDELDDLDFGPSPTKQDLQPQSNSTPAPTPVSAAPLPQLDAQGKPFGWDDWAWERQKTWGYQHQKQFARILEAGMKLENPDEL
jgi:Helix-turn-helix domain